MTGIILSLLVIAPVGYRHYSKRTSQVLLSLSFFLQLLLPLLWTMILGLVFRGRTEGIAMIVLPLFALIFYWYDTQALVMLKKVTKTWLRIGLVLLSFFVISNNVVTALQTLALPKLWDRVLVTDELGITLILFPFFVQWLFVWELPKPHLGRLAGVTLRQFWTTVLMLLAVGIYSGFVVSSHSLVSVLQLDFTGWRQVSWDNLLIGLEAALIEEIIFRGILFFLFLRVLLRRYDLHKSLLIGVVGQALCFGVSHLANLFNAQPLGITISQFIFATLFGFMVLLAYLYTGSYSLPVIFHFLQDGYFASSKTIHEAHIKSYLARTEELFIQYDYSLAVVMVLVLVYFCTGNRWQQIQRNVSILNR